MKKRRTAGFSLVEMLLAMMISMIIISGVAQFLVTGVRQYQASDRQVLMQMEAQDALNTISDMVMEGNNVAHRDEFYCVYYNLGEETSTGNRVTYSNADQRAFWLDKSTNCLYLLHCSSYSEVKKKANMQLLAENVSDFSIEAATGTLDANGLKAATYENLNGNARLTIHLTLTNEATRNAGKIEYKAEQDVAIRNAIVDLL